MVGILPNKWGGGGMDTLGIILCINPQGPHLHILKVGGGRSKNFFGSEILAKRDLFGS